MRCFPLYTVRIHSFEFDAEPVFIPLGVFYSATISSGY